jgi:hypothetical protein
MEQRGVQILAGTDTPYPYCVPGFALHEELALLEEAGLDETPTGRASHDDLRSRLTLKSLSDLVPLPAAGIACITTATGGIT